MKRFPVWIAVALLEMLAAACSHNHQRKSVNTEHTAKLADMPLISKVIISPKVEQELDALPRDFEDDSPQGKALLSQIERGDLQGMAIYKRLYPAADGGWAESLDYSMAVALLRNPQNVLMLADTPEHLDRFCAPPYIEPRAISVRRYTRAALKALRTIDDASRLAARRDSCARRLRAITS